MQIESSDLPFVLDTSLPVLLGYLPYLPGMTWLTLSLLIPTLVIIERYYPRLSAADFHTNKRTIDEIAIIPSKRLRNKIAGYVTYLMKRIQKGPVRGISFKLQEEERERKDQYVPEVSALDVSAIGGLEVDPDTKDMLAAVGFDRLPVSVTGPVSAFQQPERRGRNVPGAGRR